MMFRVERERWISKENPENSGSGILHGYDEIYYETVAADYFGVDEHGTAVFYRKAATGVGVGYTTHAVAAYADGDWKTIKEVTNETVESHST